MSISCTFVKCKHNDYGRLGTCQLENLQIGGMVNQGESEVHPVCAEYQQLCKTDEFLTQMNKI